MNLSTVRRLFPNLPLPLADVLSLGLCVSWAGPKLYARHRRECVDSNFTQSSEAFDVLSLPIVASEFGLEKVGRCRISHARCGIDTVRISEMRHLHSTASGAQERTTHDSTHLSPHLSPLAAIARRTARARLRRCAWVLARSDQRNAIRGGRRGSAVQSCRRRLYRRSSHVRRPPRCAAAAAASRCVSLLACRDSHRDARAPTRRHHTPACPSRASAAMEAPPFWCLPARG